MVDLHFAPLVVRSPDAQEMRESVLVVPSRGRTRTRLLVRGRVRGVTVASGESGERGALSADRPLLAHLDKLNGTLGEVAAMAFE
jgi:hypothetical protein